MNEFSHFNLYGTLLAVKDAVARKSITELVTACGLLRDITNNLLEKSLGHDESIGDIFAEIDSINGAIEDIEETIGELDGDISALENEVADISSNIENLRIVVNADNETETYSYMDETYGIKVKFYRRGKNVLMFLWTLSGLLAELPTKSTYYTLLTIPTQFRPAIDTIMTRAFSTIYGGQLNISQTIKIGYCNRINYVTYDSSTETISYLREREQCNLPKDFSFYYRDSWVAK